MDFSDSHVYLLVCELVFSVTSTTSFEMKAKDALHHFTE